MLDEKRIVLFQGSEAQLERETVVDHHTHFTQLWTYKDASDLGE